MRRLLFVAFVLLFGSSLALAQGGVIGLYADPAGTECNVNDLPGLIFIYVIHQYFPQGATSAEFMVNPAAGANMIFLTDIIPNPYIAWGNSQTGITIVFAGCVTTPNLILTMEYFGQGISPQCSLYEVLPDPAAAPPGEVWIWDCTPPSGNQIRATGGLIYVNPDPVQCSCTVPVEKTTWGGLKALYH